MFISGERNCLLVHGILSEYGTFSGRNDVAPWAEAFCDNVLAYDYGWANGVEDNARMLRTVLDALPGTHIDVYAFAHSNGGLVSRALVQIVGEADLPTRLAAITTLDTPHDGAEVTRIESWFDDQGIADVRTWFMPQGLEDLLDRDPGSVIYQLAHPRFPTPRIYCVAGVDTRQDSLTDGLVTAESAETPCEDPSSKSRWEFTPSEDESLYVVHELSHTHFQSIGESAAVTEWLGWGATAPPPVEDCWGEGDEDADGLSGCDDADCWTESTCAVGLTSITPTSAAQASSVAVVITGEHFRTDGTEPRLYAGPGITITDGQWIDEHTLNATFSVGCDAPVGVVQLEFAQPDETGTSCYTTGRSCMPLFEVTLNPSCGTDADGDGVPAAEDCDDTNPMSHAGATERCDGVDNDCDSATDPGCTGPTYHSGTLSVDETWTAASGPHVFSGALTVPSGVTLTIEAGADVWTYGGALLIYGGLDAVGTAGQEIRFTSTGTPAAPGDWSGIVLESGSTATIEYADIEYAITGLTVGSEDVTFTDSEILYSSGYGVNLGGNQPAVADDPARFARNVVTGGLNKPVYAALVRGGLLDASNDFRGNADDRVVVAVGGGAVEGDMSLAAINVPWYTPRWDRCYVLVSGPATPRLTVEAGAQWDSDCDIWASYTSTYPGAIDLEAGATLRFSYGAVLRAYDGGSLAIAGTPSAMVHLTSAGSVPAPGDWSGIVLESGSTATITHADIEYASTGLTLGTSDATVSDSLVCNSAQYGIYVPAGVTPTLSGMSYCANPEDVHYE